MTAPHLRAQWREILADGIVQFAAQLDGCHAVHQYATGPTVTLVGQRKGVSHLIGWWNTPELIGDLIADDLIRLRGDYLPVPTVIGDGLPYQRDGDPVQIVKAEALGVFKLPPICIVFPRELVTALSYALRFNPYETGAKS